MEFADDPRVIFIILWMILIMGHSFFVQFHSPFDVHNFSFIFSQEPNKGYEIEQKPNNPTSKSIIRKCKKKKKALSDHPQKPIYTLK